jgi:hypothetical protein
MTRDACRECWALQRELDESIRTDAERLRQRLREVAIGTGRNPRGFSQEWVFSVAKMPDNEMRAVLELQYPRTSETQRKRSEHERLTGHVVLSPAIRMLAKPYGL